MPLIGSVLKAKMQQTILNGLKREFGSEDAKATDSWQKMANAFSDVAMDIVDALHNDATVAPGIPVTTEGSAAAQAGQTIAPGNIL